MGQQVHGTSGKDPCKNCPERAPWKGRGGGRERERWLCSGVQLEEKGAGGKMVKINRNRRGSSARDPSFPPPKAAGSPLGAEPGRLCAWLPLDQTARPDPYLREPCCPEPPPSKLQRHARQAQDPREGAFLLLPVSPGLLATSVLQQLCSKGSLGTQQRCERAPGVELSLLDTFSPFIPIIFGVSIKSGRAPKARVVLMREIPPLPGSKQTQTDPPCGSLSKANHILGVLCPAGATFS